MYKFSFLFLTILLSFFTEVHAVSNKLSWEAPAINEDGSSLTDLAGYKVYYGTSSGSYSEAIDVGNVTTYDLTNMTDGLTYYFTVTAYDTSGNESDYSNEISKLLLSSGFNSVPSVPVLVYPSDNQISLETTVMFQWNESTDPDGDTATYDFYLCTDRDMTSGCITNHNIAFRSYEHIYYAGINSYGSWMFLFGIVSFLITRMKKSKSGWVFIAAIAASGILLTACGSGGNGSAGAGNSVGSSVIYTVSGLNSGTTFYWKVVANDGNSGESDSVVNSFSTE